MNSNKKLDPERVLSQSDLARFVAELKNDLDQNNASWQNTKLDGYLDALSSWIEDMDGYYNNNSIDMDRLSVWQIAATMLLAAKFYE